MKAFAGIAQCDLLQVICKVKCGHCSASNWIVDSNPEDETKMDQEGVLCWKCKKESFFESSITMKQMISSDIKNEHMNAEEGHQDPGEVLFEKIL